MIKGKDKTNREIDKMSTVKKSLAFETTQGEGIPETLAFREGEICLLLKEDKIGKLANIRWRHFKW